MSRNDTYSEFLVRRKGPPQEGCPPSSNLVTEEALTLDFLIAAIQAYRKSAMIIYEDDEGNVDLRASQAMGDQLGGEGLRRLSRSVENAREASCDRKQFIAQSLIVLATNDLTSDSMAHTEDFDLSSHQKEVLTVSFGDSKAFREWYKYMFETVQQDVCKVLSKAWIKRKHPQKAGKNPYKGRELSKPPWWPNEIVHCEPDHMGMEGMNSLPLSELPELIDKRQAAFRLCYIS